MVSKSVRLGLLVLISVVLSSCGYILRTDSSEKPNAGATSATMSALPPIMVDPLIGDQSIEVSLDRTVVFNVEDPENWTGEVAFENIAAFVPGGNMGTWTANPSLTLIAPGTTSITLKHNNSVTSIITLTVTDNTAVQMDKVRQETQVVADQVVGKEEIEAIDFINAQKTSAGDSMSSRIGRRDSESFALTMDYRPSRITLEIDNGIVTKATVG